MARTQLGSASLGFRVPKFKRAGRCNNCARCAPFYGILYPGFRIRSDATGLLRGFEPMPATFLRFLERAKVRPAPWRNVPRASECVTLPFSLLHPSWNSCPWPGIPADFSPSLSLRCWRRRTRLQEIVCNYFSKPRERIDEVGFLLREEKSSTFEIRLNPFILAFTGCISSRFECLKLYPGTEDCL